MPRVKTSSLNDSFKGDVLCLYWCPDALSQQANKVQKRSLGDLRAHQPDYWGRWDLIDFHTEGVTTRQNVSIYFTVHQQTSQIWCRCANWFYSKFHTLSLTSFEQIPTPGGSSSRFCNVSSVTEISLRAEVQTLTRALSCQKCHWSVPLINGKTSSH